MVILIEQIEIPASYEKLHAPRPFIKRRPFDSKPPQDFEGPAGAFIKAKSSRSESSVDSAGRTNANTKMRETDFPS